VGEAQVAHGCANARAALRMGPLWLFGLLFLIGTRPVGADIIHLKSGGRIECIEGWVEGETVYYRLQQGVLGFPVSKLDRIEKTEMPERRETQSTPAPVEPPQMGASMTWRLAPEVVGEKSPTYRRAEAALAGRDYATIVRELSGTDSFPEGLLLGFAHTQLRNWPMALSVLERFQVEHPRDADLNYLLGLCHYYLGHDEQAIRYLQLSLAARDDTGVRDLLGRIERQNTGRTESLHTSHFLLKYDDPSDARLAMRVLDTLERAYGDLERVLGYAPDEEVRVVMTGRRQFYDITRAPEWSAAVNDGRIYLPIGGLTEINDLLERAIRHELAHSFVQSLTNNNMPAWLNEGLCMYITGETPESYAPILFDRSAQNKLVPLASLESSFKGYAGAESAELAYAEALVATNYLAKLYGFGEINRLLRTLADGTRFEDALRERFKMDYLELEEKVREHLLAEAARHHGEGIRVR